MRWTRKVEKEKVEINPDNIPKSNKIPNESNVYVELSLMKFLKKPIPDLDFQDIKQVLLMCVIFIIVSSFTKSIVEQNESTVFKNTEISMVELIDMVMMNGPLVIIVLFMFAYTLSRIIGSESRKEVYILSDESVISTVYGRDETSRDRVSEIEFEDIEDIEFEGDSVRFVSSHNDIQIKNLPGEEVEDIQNRVMFNQDR